MSAVDNMVKVKDDLSKYIINISQEHEILKQKHAEMEHILKIGNEQIVEIQAKMSKLNDLDIFVDRPKYHYEVGTFAQSGEDMIVSFIVMVLGIPINEVSYLDLGANHAKHTSNTYHFYKQGSRGVLVEANPALIPELKFYRNEDVILNRCVSNQSGDMVDFYIMGATISDGDGLSTSDKSVALEMIKINPNLKIHNTIRVETISVNDVIENYMSKAPTILNIDIEGKEMEILKSMNFNKYRPLIIIVEAIPYSEPFKIISRNKEIINFMESIEYIEYAFTGINFIFLDKKQLIEQGRFEK